MFDIYPSVSILTTEGCKAKVPNEGPDPPVLSGEGQRANSSSKRDKTVTYRTRGEGCDRRSFDLSFWITFYFSSSVKPSTHSLPFFHAVWCAEIGPELGEDCEKLH